MDGNDFFRVIESAPVFFAACTEPELDNLVAIASVHLPNDCMIRVLRGTRCRTKHELLQEFAAALQFPFYFGHNWNAFEECLGDLDWLPGRLQVWALPNADQVLASAPGELPVFCNILTNSMRTLAEVSGFDPKHVHLILQADPALVRETRQRFADSGLASTSAEHLFQIRQSLILNCFDVYEEAKRIGESLKEGGHSGGDELFSSVMGATSSEALTNIWVAARNIRKQKGLPLGLATRLRTLQKNINRLLRPTPFKDLMSWFRFHKA